MLDDAKSATLIPKVDHRVAASIQKDAI